MNPSTKLVPFELSMLGGVTERRFNSRRAKLDFSWGALAEADISDELRAEARGEWTRRAFIEYRSAAGMTAVAETLIAARAPLDLTALASSFAADELSHAEMCARVVAELGGAEPLLHAARDLIWPKPPMRLHPLLRAAEICVRAFCVAEAFALPMAQQTAKQAAGLPLVGEVVHRIAKDEASHAAFGWLFLDWAETWLTDDHRAHLTKAAQASIDEYREAIHDRGDEHGTTLGWISDRDYKVFGDRAIENDVCRPLRMRGIEVV